MIVTGVDPQPSQLEAEDISPIKPFQENAMRAYNVFRDEIHGDRGPVLQPLSENQPIVKSTLTNSNLLTLTTLALLFQNETLAHPILASSPHQT